MKLKKFVLPILAICLAFGICMMSACGEKGHTHSGTDWRGDENNHWKVCTEDGDRFDLGPHTYENGVCSACGRKEASANPTFSVTIEDNGATLTGISVLFYSTTNSKAVPVSNKSASAELAEGDYVVYLTGVLDGYLYTPIRLNTALTSGTIKLQKATPNADGKVPYQVLYLLEEDKILEGDPDSESGQICTVSAPLACYDIYFDEFHMGTFNSMGQQFYLQKDANQIHAPHLENGIPDGYTFDDNRYHTPENGGFCSVLFDKA